MKVHLVDLGPHSHPWALPPLCQCWQAAAPSALKRAEADELGGTWLWWLSLALLSGLVRAHGRGVEVAVPASGAADVA